MTAEPPILVTGAAGSVGAVGRTVVELLCRRALRVRAFVHREDDRSQTMARLHAQGRYDRLTHDVEQVTGKAPAAIGEMILRHSAQFESAATRR